MNPRELLIFQSIQFFVAVAFWPCSVARGTIELGLPAAEAPSLNCWTTGEAPLSF